MSLEKTSELGTIKVNDYVIAKIILGGIAKSEDKMFCASSKGKLLGGLNKKVSYGELSTNILITSDDEHNCFEVTFFTVVQFGAGIKAVSQTVMDYIMMEILTLFPHMKVTVRMKIIGTKSKNIAERNIEVIRQYEGK